MKRDRRKKGRGERECVCVLKKEEMRKGRREGENERREKEENERKSTHPGRFSRFFLSHPLQCGELYLIQRGR